MADTGFVIPSLAEIVTRTKGDLNARMGNSNALVRRSLSYVLAYVLGGIAWGLYRYQRYIANQVIPDTATGPNLVRWARIWDRSKVPGTKAAGAVVVTAVAGASVSTGALYQRQDGREYLITGGPYVWAVSGTQDVSVEAVLAGTDGNYAYASTAYLTLVSAPAGVVARAPLEAAGITGGTDDESDAALLRRVELRIQEPPQGGADADYEGWAREVLPTVDRVWVFGPEDGVADGWVYVRFTVQADVPTPSAGDVTTVSNYLRSRSRRPVAAHLDVDGTTGHPVSLSITLHCEEDADVSDTKDAILAELVSMARDRVEIAPGGASVPNSYLLEAIGAAAGVDWFALTTVDGGLGTDDIALAAYEYPVFALGITWNVV